MRSTNSTAHNRICTRRRLKRKIVTNGTRQAATRTTPRYTVGSNVMPAASFRPKAVSVQVSAPTVKSASGSHSASPVSTTTSNRYKV